MCSDYDAETCVRSPFEGLQARDIADLMRPSMRSFYFIFAAILALLPSCSSLKRDPEVIITVFSQGNEMDSPKSIFRRVIAGRSYVFRIIPEITTKSIIAMHPFRAEDGTNGVALKLDFKGTNNLELVTRMRQGEILVTMVNGAVVDYLVIDRVVSDGIFTIWRGLPDELIAAMEKDYPRINEVTSSSEMINMTPSTSIEKKDIRKRAEKAAKEKIKAEKEAAKKAARGEFDPEIPAGEAVPLSEALKEL
jgi:hypothetical protein